VSSSLVTHTALRLALSARANVTQFVSALFSRINEISDTPISLHVPCGFRATTHPHSTQPRPHTLAEIERSHCGERHPLGQRDRHVSFVIGPFEGFICAHEAHAAER
jgi:hypothetical protein